MMFRHFSRAQPLVVLLIFACVWLWRASSLQAALGPASVERIVTDFVFLPALICIVLWLMKRLMGPLTRAKICSRPFINQPETPGQIPVQPGCLYIYDSELRLPIGDCADAIVLALTEQDLPGFHPSLKTANGLPLRAAWIPDLITADFCGDGSHLPQLETTVQRALLLALDTLQSIALRFAERSTSKALLHIHFLPPERWDVDTLKAAEEWLTEGFDSSILPSMPSRIIVNPVHNSRGALEYLNELITQIVKGQDDAYHLLLVSDSSLGRMPTACSPNDVPLHRMAQPKDVIPGEGACALLVRYPQLPRSKPTLSQVPTVLCHTRDALTNNAIHPLSVLLDHCGVTAHSVGTLISDSSHHETQQAQVAELQREFLPELNPIQDCLALTAACGEIGAVAPIASLALAAHLSMNSQKNCLVVSVHDDEWQATALVLSPSLEVQPAHNEPV